MIDTTNTRQAVKVTSNTFNSSVATKLSDKLEDLFTVPYINSKKREGSSLVDTVYTTNDLVNIAVEYLVVSNCLYKFKGLIGLLSRKTLEESESLKSLTEHIELNANLKETAALLIRNAAVTTDLVEKNRIEEELHTIQEEEYSTGNVIKNLKYTHKMIAQHRASIVESIDSYVSFMTTKFNISTEDSENEIITFLNDQIKLSFHPLKDWFEQAKVNRENKLVGKHYTQAPIYRVIKDRLDPYILNHTKSVYGAGILGL